ncbi:hypothetical protein Tco_0648010 [Tanacetum coccineum]
MVAYLKKQEGSEGFYQIVYVLNNSHIRYAFTKNPTIYVSLIKQFWQTASTRTLDNGEVELTATIDGTIKIVTEASVRRHLKLEDSNGISSLPTTEIFEQLSLMGYVSTSDKLTFQKGHFSPQWRFLIHTILNCLSPKKTSWEQFSSNIATAIICLTTNRKFNFSKLVFDGMGLVVQGEGSTHPVVSHHTPTSAPSTSQPLISSTSRIITRQESVGSGNIDKTPTMPHDSPLPRVNTLGSDEGSMTLEELMVFCINFSKKVESLETDLKQTKQVYGAAYIKVIMKVKKLEKTGRKIDEIDQDPDISLVQHDAEIQERHGHDMEFESNFDAAKEVFTAEEDVSTAKPVFTVGAAVTTDSVVVSTTSPVRVSTADDITMVEKLVYIRRSASKDKGKGKMDESEPVHTKTKLQQKQERLGYEAATRLQAELEEEERQRIARVHKEASSFNVEEWEDIQARIEADKELAQRIQVEEREKYTEAE